jgi:hypothetical protein
VGRRVERDWPVRSSQDGSTEAVQSHNHTMVIIFPTLAVAVAVAVRGGEIRSGQQPAKDRTSDMLVQGGRGCARAREGGKRDRAVNSPFFSLLSSSSSYNPHFYSPSLLLSYHIISPSSSTSSSSTSSSSTSLSKDSIILNPTIIIVPLSRIRRTFCCALSFVPRYRAAIPVQCSKDDKLGASAGPRVL